MTISRALAFGEAGIPIFPVRLERKGAKWIKKPHIVDWPSCATTDLEEIVKWWLRWPAAAPGIPLARCGLVVVDADRHPGMPDGVVALAGFGELPPHPVVATAGRGEHHYFRQPDPPIAENRALARVGIDILGTSRFVVGYDPAPLLGIELPELPEVFRPAKQIGYLNTCVGVRGRGGCVKGVGGHVHGDVQGLTEGLHELRPEAWREFGEWLALMTACRFVGIERDDFIEWSCGDPEYAGDGEEIARMWEHTRPTHGGALFKALSEAGIKVHHTHHHTHHHRHTSIEVPNLHPTKVHPPKSHPPKSATRNLSNRTTSLCDWLNRQPTEANLFKVACVFAEIVAEGRLKPSQAVKLLEGNCWELRKAMGGDQFQATIGRAFRHVEVKVLEVSETATNERN